MNADALKGVTIKDAGVKGRGIFALRDFKKGELVLGWNKENRFLSEEEISDLPEGEKKYVALCNGKYLLISEPERYMNHSCDPNTINENGLDYALRDIKKGEEITGDYDRGGSLLGFECKCDSKNCRKVVRPRKLN
ncbi:MAG: SET domain-containing protein [Minisyncoccia bacterium]|jgi:SET domain-containing protein